MPLFVDHAGLNVLVHDDLDLNNNTRTLNRRNKVVNDDLAIRSTSESDSRFIEPATASNLLGGSGNLTFSFWINLDNKPAAPDRVIFNSKTSTSDSVTLKFKGTAFQIIINDFAGTSKTWNYTSITPASLTNSWNHIYVVWTDNFSNNPEVYLNGAYVAHNTTAGSGAANGRKTVTSYSFYDDVDAGQPLLGSLQSFGIWRVSSSGNPAILYNNGEPLNSGLPDESDLKAFYLFGNESDENTVNLDYTGEIGQDVSGIALKPTSGSATEDRIVSAAHETSNGVLNGVFDESTGSFVGRLNFANQLAAINTHRNGPYGYSSWRQIRTSENPISRNFYKSNTFSFVTKGELVDIDDSSQNNYRKRHSEIQNFKEPVVTQKHFPLVWGVGRHFKDEENNENYLQKFSIVSSYGNELLEFTNDEVNEKLQFDRTDEDVEYSQILNLYANGGLESQDSPITYWEFLQYKETVFPQQKYGYVDTVRNRPQFSFPYNQYRNNRTKIVTETDFGFNPLYGNVSQSQWPMDAGEDFLTRSEITVDFSGSSSNFARNGEGVLLNSITSFVSGAIHLSASITSSNSSTVEDALGDISNQIGASPLYARKHTLINHESEGTSAGMEISEFISTGGCTVFAGEALRIFNILVCSIKL